MTKLEFDSPEAFEAFFSEPNPNVVQGIVEGISHALEKDKDEALLFEISMEEDDGAYRVTLGKDQWKTAIQSCIKKYEEIEMWDGVLDAYELSKKLDEKAS